MGCTSSAQSMVATNTNSPEKHVQCVEDTDGKPNFEEVNNAKSEIEENVVNVMPTCDTLAGPIELARNNKSFVDSSSLKAEKDIHEGENFLEDKINKNTKDNYDDKISSLDEIVDRVVELYAYVSDNGADDVQDLPPKDKRNRTKTKKSENDTTDNKIPENGSTMAPEDDHIEKEISSSPTNSDSPSRATRWEAMADIAAELPPLLAVDPITGQIYAVSK